MNGLTKGITYGFRYRARNAYGWSDYSQTAFLKVAVQPSKPPTRPMFVSSTDDALTILLNLQAVEDNGETITAFGIEVDDVTGFVSVLSYDGISS